MSGAELVRWAHTPNPYDDAIYIGGRTIGDIKRAIREFAAVRS